MVVGGEGENGIKTFILSSICDTMLHGCDWIVKNDTGMPKSLSYSQITALDGIPYIFGGKDGNFATNVI